MSIATQRAKEHENRTPDVEVMGKTVKLGTLKLGGAEVPLVMGGSTARVGVFQVFHAETGLGAVVPLVALSGSTAWKGGSTARVGILCRWNRGAILGRKWMISVAKLDGFRGWKVGKLGEMLDPLETNKNPWIKTNKTSSKPTNHKKIGGYFGGDFGFRTNSTKLS